MKKLTLALLVTVGTMSFAHAAEQGNVDEAKALSEAAAAHVVEVGVEQAAKDFMTADSEWIDRDLYVLMQATDGVMIAHGGKPALAGLNLIDAKDPNGKEMGKEIVAMTAPGWVDYQWQNPVTQTIQDKASWCIPIPADSVVVCVGAYK
ncbi:MAG: cache domain-containing protein [Alphaproteobacteria bacterium]|nr:cache domain-containing protein [Alphaproteobacteria bacterium]